MPVFNNALAGAAGQATGGADASYKIDRSLRLNRDDTAFLSKTPSTGNRRTFTFSTWIKRADLGVQQALLNAGTSQAAGDGGFFGIRFRANDDLNITTYNTNLLSSTRKFRDPSAWYHIVITGDTTQTSNQFKIYVNGVLDTQGGSLTQNTDLAINNNVVHEIGRTTWDNNDPMGGYLAETYFVDGQALAPTDFGELDDNGVWQPKQVSGVTYGTNGFYLDFSDNSSDAALGYDAAGSNDWTVNNLTARGDSWDQSQTWSTNVTNPNGAYGAASNAFDGNFATHASPNNSNPMTYSHPVSNTVISSFRIYTAIYDATSITLELNGTDIKSQVSTTTGWQTITGFSGDNFSTLKWAADPSNYEVQLKAIEVNGDILVDSGIGNASGKNIDSLFDSPTNYDAGTNVGGSYCTFNPLDINSQATLTNGNLDWSTTNGNGVCRGTIGVSSGKWYWEYTYNEKPSGGGTGFGVLEVSESRDFPGAANAPNGYTYYSEGSSFTKKYGQGSNSDYGNSFAVGDVIGVALDLDNGTITFYKNGVSQGQAFSGISGTYAPSISSGTSTGTAQASFNAGQRPFAYTPPTDHKALCTQNLDDPLIEDPSDYFDTKLYTGNGGELNIGDGVVYNELLTVSGGFLSTEPATNAFNGSTSSRAKANTADAIVTFDLSSLNLTGSFEFWVTNAASEYSIDGGSTYTSSNSSTWTTATNDITGVANIKLKPSSGTTLKVTAFRNQGNILTDSTGDPYSFSPDFVWIKNRDASASNAEHHALFDQVRGATKVLYSSLANAEATQANGLSSFTSDGFNVGADGKVNRNFDGHVAWAWDAGTSNTSVSIGGLNSSVYDQSQTWSNQITGTNYTGYPKTNAFNNNTSNYCLADDDTELVFTPNPSFSNATTVKIWYYAPSLTNDAVKINGSGVGSSLTQTSGVLNHTFTVSGFTSLSWSRGTGMDVGIARIDVDGVQLVDNGVSVPNVPTLASTYRTNPTVGFSIVNASVAASLTGGPNLAHGLGKKPEFMIGKNREYGIYWRVYHKDLPENHYLNLHRTDPEQNSSAVWGDNDSLDSNVFQIGSGSPASMWIPSGTHDCIFYVWTGVEGYSKFGSYTSNGLEDGPFVYTGMKPAFVLIKRHDPSSSADWQIYDAERAKTNVISTTLAANLNSDEASFTSGYDIDFLSNGFKPRVAGSNAINATSGTYIYAAFAEHPFKTARAR